MGTCVSRQTRPDGKPQEDREQPEEYTNHVPYFIAQLVALITHETYQVSPDIAETLLLTHIFYADSIDLLIAIRDRFFMTYERYKFTTYQRESDITLLHDPNTKKTKNNLGTTMHSNHPMKRLPVPSSPTPPTPHHEVQASYSNTPSPSPQSPQSPQSQQDGNRINDELEFKLDIDTFNIKERRLRSGTIDIGYIPTKKLNFADWIINIKIVIQKKCLDLLLKWIENYWIEDFDKNEKNHQEIIELLTEFINDIKKSRDQFKDLIDPENNKKNKKKKVKKHVNGNMNGNMNGNISSISDTKRKSHHSIYASFLQSYILKLDNITATQQTWYQPIVCELRTKQKEQEKQWNEQIKISKRFKRNRLNSQINDQHYRSPSTQSISGCFSDNIFGFGDIFIHHDDDDDDDDDIDDDDDDNDDDDDDDEINGTSPRLKVLKLNEKRSNSLRAFKPRHSHSRSGTYSVVDIDNNNNIDNGGGVGMGNTLSFIAMKNQENAKEYAKQLTLLDWEGFIAIDGRTCLYKILSKKKTSLWISVKLFIDSFQQHHQYVIVSIVAAPDLKARIEMIEFFVFVAETLLKLNNLYSFMAVCTALDSVSIQKLKIAWDLLNKSTKRKFNEFLSPLCSARNNYKLLREYCKTMKPPAIPFLGLILKDLTFTNDGNHNKLSKYEDKHINFYKYLLFYRILSENINKFHSKTYSEKLKHSKQFESQDINALVQQLNIFEPQHIDNIEIDAITPPIFDDDNDGPIQYNIRIDHVNNDENKEKEEKEEKEESKSFGVDEINNMDNNRMNIIPDFELQQEILKDLNSYILLNKNVIRAMTVDANRVDLLKKDEYISEYLKPKLNATNNSRHSRKGSFFNRNNRESSISRSYSHSPKRDDKNKNNNNGKGKKSKISFKGSTNVLKKLFLNNTNSNKNQKTLSVLRE